MQIGFAAIGNSAIRSVRSYFRMLSFFGVILISLTHFRRFLKRFNRYEFLVHSYQYGPRILPKITFFSAIVSTFVTLFTIKELTIYDALSYLDNALSVIIIREAGPLLIAFFVIIYASVAIFDELEDIRMHLDAQQHSVDYETEDFVDNQILPRFFAILICMPLLYIYFVLVSFFVVSFWINISEKITLAAFLEQINNVKTNQDLFIGVIKTSIFAAVNAFFACFYGMQHEPDPKHKSLPLIKSILVNLGYLVLSDVFIEIIAFRINY